MWKGRQNTVLLLVLDLVLDMEPVKTRFVLILVLRWLKLEQEGKMGCECGESVIVGTASVPVSPLGDSSDTGVVSELTAVTQDLVMIPPGGVVVLQCPWLYAGPNYC